MENAEIGLNVFHVTFHPLLRSPHTSAEGISLAEDKKHAILDAPVPQNVPHS